MMVLGIFRRLLIVILMSIIFITCPFLIGLGVCFHFGLFNLTVFVFDIRLLGIWGMGMVTCIVIGFLLCVVEWILTGRVSVLNK